MRLLPAVLLLLLLGLTAARADAMASHRGWPPYNGMLLMNEGDSDRPLDARAGKDPFGGQDPQYGCKDTGPKPTSSCGPWLRLVTDAETTQPSRPPRTPKPKPPVVELPDVVPWLPPVALPVPVPTVVPVLVPTVTPTPSPTPTATPTATPTVTPDPGTAAPRASIARRAAYVVRRTGGHHRLYGGHGDDTIHAGDNGDVLWGDYKPSGQPSSQVDRLFGGAGPDFIYPSHGRHVIVAGAGSDVIHGHFGRGTVDCGPGRDVLYVHGGHRRRWKHKNCEVVSTAVGQSAPRWILRRLPWRITDTQERR